MLSSGPDNSWLRIARASAIIATRPALTSASAPFSMTRRLPLPARRSLASIERTMESRSGRRFAAFRNREHPFLLAQFQRANDGGVERRLHAHPRLIGDGVTAFELAER